MNFNKLFSSFLIAFLILMIAFASSCENNHLVVIEDPDPPNPQDTMEVGCDTIEISYSATIAVIIENNCFTNCHNGSAPTSGFLLSNYNALKAKVDDNRLLGALNQQVGFVPMPLSQPLIPACDRAQIKAWVEDGALDN